MLRGVADPVFNVEFVDLIIDFFHGVKVWNWAFDDGVTPCAWLR